MKVECLKNGCYQAVIITRGVIVQVLESNHIEAIKRCLHEYNKRIYYDSKY